MFRQAVEAVDLNSYIQQRTTTSSKSHRTTTIMREVSPLANKKELSPIDSQSSSGWQENTPCTEESSEDSETSKEILPRKTRRASVMSLSNVKRKISSTFQRRNSITHISVEQHQHQQVPMTKDNFIKDDALEILNKRHIKTSVARSSVTSYPARKESIIGREANAFNAALDKLSNAPLEQELFYTEEFHLERTRAQDANHSNRKENYHEQSPQRHRNANFERSSILTPSVVEPVKNFCLYLMGNKSVGKTALTVRFLTARYIHEYKSVPEEKYTRRLTIEDELTDVNIYVKDIEQLKGEIVLRENSGVMVLYSVVDRYSFVTAKLILKHLTECLVTNNYPVILIGTKRDLARFRKVTREEGYDLANKNNCSYFEVSAAADKKVKDCFQSAFRQIQVRKLLSTADEEKITVLNPPKVTHHGLYRHGSI